MDNKRNKILILNTLLFVFCVVIIALFCFIPISSNEKKVVLETYNITFDSDGGGEIAAITIDEGCYIVQPESPTKEGYIFVGWMLDGELYDFSTEVTGDITLKAKWEFIEPDVTYYTITFDTGGGSVLTPLTIAEGRVPIAPSDPIKDGYTFKEWQLNGTLYDFSLPITGDITIVAIWEEAVEDDNTPKYTVKFNSDGGSKVSSQTIKEGSKANEPKNPTKSGYIFKYWALDGKEFNFKNSAVTKDIELKAVWEKAKVTYTIKFDSNNGSAVSSQVVGEGGRVTKPADPTRTGYTFDGWYYNNKEYNFNTVVNSNMTLKANWKLATYTIRFYNDSTLCGSSTLNYNNSISLPTGCNGVSKPGYKVSWVTKSGVALSSSKATSNLDFYSKFEKKSFTVTATADSDNAGTYGYFLNISGLDGDTINTFVLYYSRQGSTKSNDLDYKSADGKSGWYVNKTSMWDDAVRVEVTLVGSDEVFTIEV